MVNFSKGHNSIRNKRGIKVLVLFTLSGDAFMKYLKGFQSY